MKIIKDKTAKLSFVVLLITCLAAMFYTPTASADEFIVMDNGMTCFQTDSGEIYGCSGGIDNGSSGFNDTRTGRRYESTGDNRAIDTQTGQDFEYPDYNNSYRDDGYE